MSLAASSWFQANEPNKQAASIASILFRGCAGSGAAPTAFRAMLRTSFNTGELRLSSKYFWWPLSSDRIRSSRSRRPNPFDRFDAESRRQIPQMVTGREVREIVVQQELAPLGTQVRHSFWFYHKCGRSEPCWREGHIWMARSLAGKTFDQRSSSRSLRQRTYWLVSYAGDVPS
jgi:hypothetical protein